MFFWNQGFNLGCVTQNKRFAIGTKVLTWAKGSQIGIKTKDLK